MPALQVAAAGEQAAKPLPALPKIFNVNWFRKGTDDGKFLFPGFGENIRILRWILGRVDGSAEAIETAAGYVPKMEQLCDGLSLSESVMTELTAIRKQDWLEECERQKSFLESVGAPEELLRANAWLESRVKDSK
jgi:phosphoenolpyruvate carboxykinase (GTP)